MISNCSFSDNNGRGIALKDITADISISTVSVFRNKADGIAAERILGTIATSDTHSLNNSAHGIVVVDSSFKSFNLHQVSTKGNSRNGVYLVRVYLNKSVVSNSVFRRNSLHGFAYTARSGEVEFRSLTAVFNTYLNVLT